MGFCLTGHCLSASVHSIMLPAQRKLLAYSTPLRSFSLTVIGATPTPFTSFAIGILSLLGVNGRRWTISSESGGARVWGAALAFTVRHLCCHWKITKPIRPAIVMGSPVFWSLSRIVVLVAPPFKLLMRLITTLVNNLYTAKSRLMDL